MVTIIDGHTHIFPSEVRKEREKYVSRDTAFRALYEDPRARLAGREELLAAMDVHGVQQAVICGFPWEEVDLCRWHNDYLLESARETAGRLIPFACVSGKNPRGAVAEINRALSLGMRGVGEIAHYSAEDLLWARPLAEEAGHAGVPLMIHTSEEVGHRYPGKVLHGLGKLLEFVSAFPSLTIICSHWGGGLFFYELMPEVARVTRHLLYDTAASPFLYDSRVYEIAMMIAGPDRIIFGSDFPLLQQGRYIREIQSSGMDPSARRKILGENLGILLRQKRDA